MTFFQTQKTNSHVQRLSLVVMAILALLRNETSAFLAPKNRSSLKKSSLPPKQDLFRKDMSLQRIRGGGNTQLSSSTDTNEHDDNFTNTEKWRRRGMTAALSSTYFAVMGAKCALPSVLSLVANQKTGLLFPLQKEPQTAMASLLGLSTLAVALGKFLLGPLIDWLGGIVALQWAVVLLMLLLVIITQVQHFSVFAACWILVDFIFSSCWAGCIHAIHQSFPPQDWGRQIGMLAVGARTGNACAFGLFAFVLYKLENTVKQPWRVVFAVSAFLQIIPLVLLNYFGRKTLSLNLSKPKEEVRTRTSFQSSLQTLQRESRTTEFWLHFVSRSCLMVFASFLLFVPTLMSQIYRTSNGFAAQTGSIYAIGCLLSISLGSSLYAKLPKRKQALTNCILLSIATLSSLSQLAHVSGILALSPVIGALSMFLWGFSFAIPFYIPPSLYALTRGKSSSATIADVFDIGGFGLLALFNGYVAGINHTLPKSWIPAFQITSTCSLLSLVSLVLAVLRQ
jgi:MFS family permease